MATQHEHRPLRLTYDATGRPPQEVGRPRDGTTATLGGLRVVAALAVLLWWVLMFGLIDLATPFVGPAYFYDSYLLETGWGLLYTVLLGVATLALVWRPWSTRAAVQLLIVGGALALVALATPELGHLVPAAIAAGLGLTAVRLATGSVRLPAGYLHVPRGGWRVPAAVVAVAVVPAVVYAVSCPWRTPTHAAGSGAAGGIAALAWAVTYIVAWEVTRRHAAGSRAVVP